MKYKYLVADIYVEKGPAEVARTLELYGNMGWRLVTAIDMTNEHSIHILRLFFMKEDKDGRDNDVGSGWKILCPYIKM